MDNQQKTLVLTGASRGIGHATVRRFNSEGWRVITISRQPFDGRCPWAGGRTNHIVLDLQRIGDMERAIDQIARLVDGRLEALINNAAISPKAADGLRLSSLSTAYGDWLAVFNVNFFAVPLLAQGLRDELIAGKGSIVNVTSIVGSRVHKFAGSAYATSKAALSALTREMAADFGDSGVRVNSVAPGEIDTAILSPGTQEIVDTEIPMRRLGTPSEVADLLFFLCSNQAAYITGSEIHINGGQHV